MATNIETGKLGEDLATRYLEDKGYRIVERNYRAGRGEIDIIAWENEQLLVFVEVKTRSGDGYGGPEEAVNNKKMDIWARTAGYYMEQIGYEWAIRFDIIAIILDKRGGHKIRHVQDAFFPMS